MAIETIHFVKGLSRTPLLCVPSISLRFNFDFIRFHFDSTSGDERHRDKRHQNHSKNIRNA